MRMRHVIESPIEAMMLAALYRIIDSRGGIDISTQREVSTASGIFRLDLVLESKGRRLAIECDGAEWHASPAQRERDAARDAALLVVGWRVVRFTGSEIMRDAEGCAIRASVEMLRQPARPTSSAPAVADVPGWSELLEALSAALPLCACTLRDCGSAVISPGEIRVTPRRALMAEHLVRRRSDIEAALENYFGCPTRLVLEPMP